MRPHEFLEGPRARRLCLEVACALSEEVRLRVFDLAYRLDPGAGVTRVMLTFSDGQEAEALEEQPLDDAVAGLVMAISALDPAALGEPAITAALFGTVQSARYWQEPDGEDELVALEPVRSALAPLAESLLADASTAWWNEPRQSPQWRVTWGNEAEQPVASTLSAWATAEAAAEVRAQRDRPRGLTGHWTGEWWSIPLGLGQTVDLLPSGQPAALTLLEDSFGPEAAVATAVHPAGRVFEVHGPSDWLALCRIGHLDVSASRRHDWFRVTGRDGAWVVPDWTAVAQEWDAVHVSVLGYLTTSGRALDLDGALATVLAGWSPATTVWLHDRIFDAELPPVRWHGRDDEWRRVSGEAAADG